ncbi:MAG: recombinase RecT [Bacteroidales bacterium]|nr:recombinase RecT [Bacteroidales bacterium]
MENQEKFSVNKLTHEEIINDPYVRQKFIDILSSLHKVAKPDAESIYEKERLYFLKALNDPKTKLASCTKISIFSTFVEIAIQNLSIQDGAKSEAYVEARGTKKGTDEHGKDIWENIARLVITTYGELNLRMRAGQIVQMTNPIVVYEGDIFQPRTNEKGILYVEYAPAIPRKSNKIIGSWVAIYLPGGLIDFKFLLQEDIERLKNYSIPKGKNSSAGPNALYTSSGGQIDPGFLETKTIKHAMRSRTKLRVMGNAEIEDEEYEEQAKVFTQPANTVTERQQEAAVVMEDNDGIF